MTPSPGTQKKSGFTATSRQEFIADILMPNVNTQYMLPTNGGLIPNDRFMYGMWIIFEGRATNTGVPPTGVRADGPINIIQNVTISGYHRVRGQNEQFINVRGVDLYNLNRAYQNAVPYLEPSNGWPQFNPSLSVVGNEFNDFRFALYIPFVPQRVPINQQMGWLLDAPNYDRLQLQITMGDSTCVFQGLAAGGADTTWSAYGSATGSPRIRVQGQFALGGTSVYGYVPARTWRYYQEFIGSIATTTGNTVRLYNIPRGNKIRNLLLKVGAQAASNLTAGNVAYDTLTDDALLNILVQRGLNKSIRFYPDFRSLKYEIQQSYGMYQQSGYALLDFAQRGRLTEALNTVGLVAGPSGDTDLYVQADVTGNPNQAFLFLVEELRNIPRSIALPGK